MNNKDEIESHSIALVCMAEIQGEVVSPFYFEGDEELIKVLPNWYGLAIEKSGVITSVVIVKTSCQSQDGPFSAGIQAAMSTNSVLEKHFKAAHELHVTECKLPPNNVPERNVLNETMGELIKKHQK